jgi:hypothetical protein
MRMEERLVKTGRTEEFVKQCQGNINRGAFRHLTGEELGAYKGSINYISMVEAYKIGPFATTPLRICMNSSMKQPMPSEVSLYNCLLKGPPALADLYTVTLGIREHKVTFTKDISKFYQCMEADKMAQHVMRILWRFGDIQKDPDILVTTGVHYEDWVVGCITIVTVRETAERFGGSMEEAAWFLKNKAIYR